MRKQRKNTSTNRSNKFQGLFDSVTKSSLQRVIHSDDFKNAAISEGFAEALSAKCDEFGLVAEANIVRSRIVNKMNKDSKKNRNLFKKNKI